MTVTISPKFQIVIPKAMRESLKLKKGMKIELISYNGNIVLVPIKSIQEMMGKFKGMDTNNIREKKDRSL
jgi:AbrB family looped-hinge helix DNA binding protein